jgi:hypothetical protein
MVLKSQEKFKFRLGRNIQAKSDSPVTLITALIDILSKSDVLEFLGPMNVSNFSKERPSIEACCPKYVAIPKARRSEDIFYHRRAMRRPSDVT